MKEELITRLQNACAQRDEARAQVMELEARLHKAASDLANSQDEARKAIEVAAAAGPAHGGAADANGGPPGGEVSAAFSRMGKGASAALEKLASQGPGMARMMKEAANTYLGPDRPHGAAGAAGASFEWGVGVGLVASGSIQYPPPSLPL
jgi:hypothetical protein